MAIRKEEWDAEAQPAKHEVRYWVLSRWGSLRTNQSVLFHDNACDILRKRLFWTELFLLPLNCN
jgi:hypothetical protein